MTSLAIPAGAIHYLRDFMQCRYFLLALVRIDLRNRYKRSVLGIGWTMLHPIAMTAVLCGCFSVIFDIKLADYVPFLLTGTAMWGFFAGCVSEGCQTFYAAQGYIKAERVPLALFPLRTVLGLVIHFSITMIISLLAALLFKGAISPWPLLSLIPTWGLMVIFGWSVTLLMAFVSAHFPDSQHLSTVALQLGYYLTPVLYPPSVVVTRGLGNVFRWNPMTYFLELVRAPIVNNAFPSWTAYGIAAGFTAILFCLALTILYRCERRLIFALL
jgi:lipopolysaccharide transport system permease protein